MAIPCEGTGQVASVAGHTQGLHSTTLCSAILRISAVRGWLLCTRSMGHLLQALSGRWEQGCCGKALERDEEVSSPEVPQSLP